MFLQNVGIYQLGCRNLEDHSLNNHCHKNLKTFVNMLSLLQRIFMYYIFIGQTVNASIQKLERVVVHSTFHMHTPGLNISISPHSGNGDCNQLTT